jgi:hypothetical protein
MPNFKPSKKAAALVSLVFVALFVGILKRHAIHRLWSPPKPVAAKPAEVAQNETLDESAYQMVIKGRLAQVQACYNAELKKGLNKEGNLVVKWVVTPDGKASEFTEEKNDLGSSELYDCTISAIAAWPFPKNETFMIRYTFKMHDLKKQKRERDVATTTKSKEHAPDEARDDVKDQLGEL